MRLKLAREKNDVAVLEVQGEVGSRDLEVLRAGLGKLLHSGRNRIILSLHDAETLDLALLREIAKINALAQELDGALMLVGRGDLIRQAARGDAAPLPRCYATTKAALAAMSDLAAAVPAEVDYRLGEDPNGLLKKRVAQLASEYGALKLKAQALTEATALRELRRENGRLGRELELLTAELARVKADRRPAFHFDDLDRKVELLTRTLASLLAKEGAI